MPLPNYNLYLESSCLMVGGQCAGKSRALTGDTLRRCASALVSHLTPVGQAGEQTALEEGINEAHRRH